jgi:hypothetical protein
LLEPIDSYKRKGYPLILLFEHSFEIRGKDNAVFRKFNFDEVEKLKFYDPNNNWWTRLLMAVSSFNNPTYLQYKRYRYLKLIKKNGGVWKYRMPISVDKKMIDLLKKIELESKRDFLDVSF